MWERGEAECSRQRKEHRKILHVDMLPRLEGGLCNGRWVRRRPEMMGREGTGWPRSSIMGSVCFAKIALMLSEPLKGKRTQKTMQICMRLVKVERERWTNPRYETELTQPSGLTLRVRGRESGPTARRFAASKQEGGNFSSYGQDWEKTWAARHPHEPV